MDGIINCYKPIGMTSFDAVNLVKKILKEKKVGHTGTLDPAASGVLPICFGKATKLIDYIMEGKKGYRVEMTLGVVTDTYDKEGKVIYQKEVTAELEEIKKAVTSFTGEIMQVPPMYSALKHKGKRLYELAREGIEIERAPRKITIDRIEILSIDKTKVIFDVECSKGTYIRSLCFDIGNTLGCGAMMSNLERLFSGEFYVNEAINVRDLNSENISQYIISMDKALDRLPKLVVDSKFEKLLRNGVEVKDRNLLDNIEKDKYRIYNKENQLLGVGKCDEASIKISTLLI